MWWDCIFLCPSTPSYSALTKNQRPRRWIAVRRCFPCGLASHSDAATITSGTARRPLFATLAVTTGCHRKMLSRQHAAEFSQFLDEIEAAVPAELDVHLVWDNYAKHKTTLSWNWLANRPRSIAHGICELD
jgi:hypothetical protein